MAVPLGNGLTVALGAQGKTAFTAQFADIVGSTGNQAGSNQTGRVPLASGNALPDGGISQAGVAAFLAAQGRASGASGATQSTGPRVLPTAPSLAGQTTTPTIGRFGTPTATPTTNQLVTNKIAATTSQVAATAATADQNSVQSAAQADASSTKPGADDNPTAPGAAELNARVVAGATMLAAHPSAALTSTAKDLLQPGNSAASTTSPNPATVNGQDKQASQDKASNASDGTIAATSTSIAPPPGTTTTDLPGASSALARQPAQPTTRQWTLRRPTPRRYTLRTPT